MVTVAQFNDHRGSKSKVISYIIWAQGHSITIKHPQITEVRNLQILQRVINHQETLMKIGSTVILQSHCHHGTWLVRLAFFNGNMAFWAPIPHPGTLKGDLTHHRGRSVAWWHKTTQKTTMYGHHASTTATTQHHASSHIHLLPISHRHQSSHQEALKSMARISRVLISGCIQRDANSSAHCGEKCTRTS